MSKNYVYRRDLPRGGTPFTGRASLVSTVKQELLQYDKFIELHELSDGVGLYRLKTCGATAGSDYLAFQCKLPRPPGSWLVESIKKNDAWRKHGDGQRATKMIIRQEEEAEQLRERNRRLRVSQVSTDMAKDIVRYVIRERRTVSLS